MTKIHYGRVERNLVNKNAIEVYFLKGGCLKSDIPVIHDFSLGKTVNEPKTLGTTGLNHHLD